VIGMDMADYFLWGVADAEICGIPNVLRAVLVWNLIYRSCRGDKQGCHLIQLASVIDAQLCFSFCPMPLPSTPPA
jgi:hypothetical protein